MLHEETFPNQCLDPILLKTVVGSNSDNLAVSRGSRLEQMSPK